MAMSSAPERSLQFSSSSQRTELGRTEPAYDLFPSPRHRPDRRIPRTVIRDHQDPQCHLIDIADGAAPPHDSHSVSAKIHPLAFPFRANLGALPSREMRQYRVPSLSVPPPGVHFHIPSRPSQGRKKNLCPAAAETWKMKQPLPPI